MSYSSSHHRHRKQLLCLLLSAMGYARAQSLDPAENTPLEEINKTYLDVQIGTDLWAIAHNYPNSPESIQPELTEKLLKDNIHMPDGLNQWNYQNLSPWATVHLVKPISPTLSATLKAMLNQSAGARVDELSLEYAFSYALGVRTGIVDYKMSLCTDYDIHNYWIQDPNEFCADPMNKTLTSAAPGLQVYFNRLIKPYRVQSLVGVYNAKLMGYSNFENGRRTLDAQRPTDSNHKWGAAINILNMRTGSQYRFSWLRSVIDESPEGLFGDDSSHQTNDIFYLAMQTALTEALSLGLSASLSKGDIRDLQRETIASRYDHEYNSTLSISNWGLALTYDQGIDKYNLAYYNLNRRKFYSAIDMTNESAPVTIPEAERSNYTRQSLGLSWTHEWHGGLTSTLQIMRNVLDISINALSPLSTNASALGARLSYRF